MTPAIQAERQVNTGLQYSNQESKRLYGLSAPRFLSFVRSSSHQAPPGVQKQSPNLGLCRTGDKPQPSPIVYTSTSLRRNALSLKAVAMIDCHKRASLRHPSHSPRPRSGISRSTHECNAARAPALCSCYAERTVRSVMHAGEDISDRHECPVGVSGEDRDSIAAPRDLEYHERLGGARRALLLPCVWNGFGVTLLCVV